MPSAICPRNGANAIKYVKSCSIKGKVKNIFLPPPEVRIGSAIPSPLADEWFFGVVPRDCSRPSHRFTVLAATTPSDPETHKRYGCSVATMVLSETRGLVLFRVIRGGIGLTQRLGVVAPSAYRTSAYSPSTPNVARVSSPTASNSSPEDGKGLSSEDVQATCGFSFSASKVSPFFHSARAMAAILRVSVSRARLGFMPLASNP